MCFSGTTQSRHISGLMLVSAMRSLYDTLPGFPAGPDVHATLQFYIAIVAAVALALSGTI